MTRFLDSLRTFSTLTSSALQLFRDVFRLGRKRGWKFNHSSLFLDFLAGNQIFECTPWGNPTRNVFGWQRPCYLLVDEGYAPSFRSLMEDTQWDRYGTGRNSKCANCMAHCGYEPTAVNAAFTHPLKALQVSLYGPVTEGPKAPENSLEYASSLPERAVEIPVDMLDAKRKIIN